MVNELAVRKNGAISIAGFSLTSTAAVIPAKATEDDWRQAWLFIRRCEGSVMWWIGDMLNTAEARWGETYAKTIEECGYAEKTLNQAKYVSGAVNFSIRIEKLSWGHHLCVAPLTERDQKRWLAKAIKENLSVAELRQQIREDAHPGEERVLWDFIQTLTASVNRIAADWPPDARHVLSSQLRRLADEAESGALFEDDINDDRGEGSSTSSTATA